MAIARMVGGWLTLLAWLAMLAAGARAEEAGGRRLEVPSASLAVALEGEDAPPGFRYLRLELSYTNIGAGPIADVALGSQAWLLEDGLFPYFAEERVGPIDQSALFRPATLAPQETISTEMVVLVPARPGALALVYEADGVRLELPLAPAEAVPDAADSPPGPVDPGPAAEVAEADAVPADEPAAEEIVADEPVAEPMTGEAAVEEPLADEPSATAEGEPLPDAPAATAASSPMLVTDRAAYEPGDTIRVTVSGLPGNTQDWLTLVAEGAPEDTLGQWLFTDGVAAGAFEFRAPPATGPYEVRVYFDFPDGGYTVQARTTVAIGIPQPEPAAPPDPVPPAEVEVEPAPEPSPEASHVVLATDSDLYRTGDAIVLVAEGLPGAAEDMLTLVPIGDPDDAYGEWTYTGAVTSGSFSFTAPQPGLYEFRLLPADTIAQVAARLPIRVEEAPAQPPEVAEADQLEPPLAPAGSEAEPPATEEPATTPAPEIVLTVDAEVYRQGDPIAADVTGLPGLSGEWITLVAADTPDDTYGEWQYTEGATEESFVFTAPRPGSYELRVILPGPDGQAVAARLPVTVEGPPEPAVPTTEPALAIAEQAYRPGETILVAYRVPQPFAANAWVGIVPSEVPHGSGEINDLADIGWASLGEVPVGMLTMTAPAEPGRYDLRLTGSAAGTLLEAASVSFAVSPDRSVPPEESPPPSAGLAAPATPVNVAAQPFGARAFGGYHAARLHDGRVAVDAYDGLASAELGAPLILHLDRTYLLERLRLRLPDGDGRSYGYRLDGTVDGSSWQLLAGSAVGARGWQEIDLARPTAVRTLRLVGTAEGDADSLEVVELEAYSRDPVPFAALASPAEEADVPLGRDLALTLFGGGAESAGTPAPALTDGDTATAWTATALPQPVEIAFAGTGDVLVDAVALRTPDGQNATRPRLVELAVATGDAAAPWRTLGRFGLYDADGWQRIEIEPVRSARLQLTLLEGYDPDLPVALGEIAFLEGAADGYRSVLPGRHPGFAGGPNIAAAALGGRIERATASQDENYPPEALIDGQLYVGGEAGWITADAAMPQDVVVSFHGGSAARIAAVALNPDAGVDGYEASVRTFELWVSQTAPDSGFTRVGGFYMEPTPGWQIFAFEPVTARYVQLRILSNHGAGQTALGEFEVLEAVADDYQSILAADPPNLVATALGGHYAVPQGAERLALLDGAVDTAWYADGRDPPIDLVLAFRDQRAAVIDGITFTPPAAYPPEDRATEIKVSVSATSPIDGFATVGTFTLAPEARPQSFPFPPVEARYVQLRILANGGGDEHALAEVAVREHLQPGTLSVLSRLPADALGLAPLPAAPTLPGEPEPNDILATAVPIAPGQTREGLIDPPDDVDVYRVDTGGQPHPGITVEIVEDPVLRVGLELLDAAGAPIDAQPLYERAGSRAALSWAVPQGVYYLRVHRPPTSIVVQSDLSPSTDNVRDGITAALRAFVGQTTAFEQVSVAGFCGDVIRASEFTSDPAVLDAAVEEINYGCDGTALYAAMEQSLDWLEGQDGGRAVLVITDAEDSGDHDESLAAVWSRLGEAGARVYGIGYGSAIYYQIGNATMGSTGGDLLRAWAAATGGGYFEAPTGDAINAVSARIGEELRRPSLYRLTVTTPGGEGALSVVEVGESIAGVAAPSRIALIFDASGSMWARDGASPPRIEIAREVMRAVIGGLPDQVQVGLRVYGHRYPREPKEESCTDSELLVPFGPLDRGRLTDAIDGLNPQGQTPIGLSLAGLREDFAGVEGPKVVILVTDGIETCDPEPGDPNYPPAVVEALLAEGMDVRVNVVGFAIDESGTRDFLRRIADLSGGQYFEAADAAALQAALEQAIRAGYAVRDARGESVAAGRVNDPPLALVEGSYRVEVAADPPILVEVAVAVDEETRVLLDREGGEVGVEIETGPYDPAAAMAAVEPPLLDVPRPLSTPEEIAELQRLLAGRGHDPGPADGRAGPATAAAIRDYQQANGLAVTGVADMALLEQLRAPPAASGEERPAEVPDPEFAVLPPVIESPTAVPPAVEEGGTISSTPSDGPVLPDVTLYDAPRTMYATSPSSRVRSGPGTDYPQVASLPFASQVSVLGEAEGWYFLETATGVRGFTSGRLLSATRPAAGGGGGATTPPQPAVPGCPPGETLIEIGPGRFICAMLQ